MTIRGRTFLHPVTVVEDINDNIIGIDFMYVNQTNYNATSKQITLSHILNMPCPHSKKQLFLLSPP
jgi:hypothetical protein